MNTLSLATNRKLSKLIELIFSEPNVYGNWTMQDFEYHFENTTEVERIQFLEDIIAEGSDWIVE
jgi:hypothetical protein